MKNVDPVEVKLLRPQEVVEANPKRYWGVASPTENDVNAAIVEQLQLEKCISIMVSELDGWQVISCENNWISEAIPKGKTVIDFFDTTRGLPSGGGNSLRIEFFLKILVSNLTIWFDDKLTIIKGNCEPTLEKKMGASYRGLTCILYKLS